MNIHSLYGFFARLFRGKRMALFQAMFNPGPETRILDVGGLPFNWKLIQCKSKITLLNLYLPEESKSSPPNFSFVVGDGTVLDYKDNSFDLVYSNSVIEHLHSWQNQVKFAKELSRVAKKIWVQTPAKCFFVEPHLITPFIHWLPRKWQEKLLRHFSVWGYFHKPSPETVKGFLDEHRLLNYKEMKSLFPDCEIKKEKFLGMTKAYIAVRR